ncbi:MAG: hypothetical protein AB7F43_14235 [Bacteriovoracia bacterium]
MRQKKRTQSGQAVVEYVLLLVLVVGMLFLLSNQLPRLLATLEEPFKSDFKYAYKYGDSKARGYDDDDGSGPVRHPRIYSAGNFRIFSRGPDK